jgi:hypothetical protein
MRFSSGRHTLACAAAIALLLLAGCGKDSVTAPLAGLSGPVVLTGYLTDAAGKFIGTRVFAEADGIPVQLVNDVGVVATTTTVKGRYTFTNLAHGAYKVRTQVTYDLIAETRTLTVNEALTQVADTLRLKSRGDLFPYPNPFRSSLFTTFVLPSSEQASLRVLDRAGNTVRVVLEGNFPGGQNGMAWDGNDAHGIPVPPGFYWLTFDNGNVTRAQLLFRE